MHLENSTKRKVLSVFNLVMINVVAVDSLRSLTVGAEFGLSMVFFYALGALLFLLPMVLVTAELATGWPSCGGVYVWVSEAFGPNYGFMVIWVQWIYNVIWYPGILQFIVTNLAYLYDPHLQSYKTYLTVSIFLIYWLSTFVNFFGMKLSSAVSTIGTIFGTLLPMGFITLLGVVWLVHGHASQIHFAWHEIIPTKHDAANVGFFISIIFGLIGLEMSAVHADEVKNPARDFPRALFYSALIVICSLVFASLAIAIVVPHEKLQLVSGVVDAFGIFFAAFHLSWMLKILIFLIVISAFANVSTWIIGPTKGLLVALQTRHVPPCLLKTNRHHVPVNLLLFQGVIFAVLCIVFIIFKNATSAYWLLTVLSGQLALLEYVLMFAAIIRLRAHKPHVPRAFTIPGGKVGLWITSISGILICVATIAVGFIPPPDAQISPPWLFEMLLVIGIIVFCLPPVVLREKA